MKSLFLLAALVAPASAAVVDRADPPPILELRLIAGTGGLTVDQLAANLVVTARNIAKLNAYLHPFDKGAHRPSGEEAASARRSLGEESEAARGLIVEGEAAIQRNIERRRQNSADAGIFGYLLNPIMAARSDDAAALRLQLAMARANHAGMLATLLHLKRLAVPDAEKEATYERHVASTREHLRRSEAALQR
jgi:hypothetical protein